VGHVEIETDQPEIESTATATRFDDQCGEERASSGSNTVAGGDQHLRDGDHEAQEGQVAREETQLVQLEWQKHGQYTDVGAEHG